MDEIYRCANCGQIHEEWPALVFNSPLFYDELNDEEKDELAEIGSDFCVIAHPEQTDRFIRCTLTQKVNDHCEDLEYGLWVSLNETSFNDYKENYNNENHEVSYFGWLSNWVPGYENTLSVPTTILTRTGNSRPEIVPHKDFDHQFVRDYYNGIAKEEAQRRINAMLEG